MEITLRRMMGAEVGPVEMKILERYWNEEDGLTSVEHAVLIALIVIVAMSAWGSVGQGVTATVERAAEGLPANVNTGTTSGGCEA